MSSKETTNRANRWARKGESLRLLPDPKSMSIMEGTYYALKLRLEGVDKWDAYEFGKAVICQYNLTDEQYDRCRYVLQEAIKV